MNQIKELNITDNNSDLEEIYTFKFESKQEAIDFIHKIMKAQNIKLEDIQ